MKNKYLQTSVTLVFTLFAIGCAHHRPKQIDLNRLSNGSIIKIPVEFKTHPSLQTFELIKDFHIIGESMLATWSEEKAMEKLQNLAVENNADLIVIDDARNEYARDILFDTNVQADISGNFYKKKK